MRGRSVPTLSASAGCAASKLKVVALSTLTSPALASSRLCVCGCRLPDACGAAGGAGGAGPGAGGCMPARPDAGRGRPDAGPRYRAIADCGVGGGM